MSSEPSDNLDKAVHYIREAAQKGADIVCLPELFRSPYFCTSEKCPRDYSEKVPGEVGKVLGAEARSGHIAVVGGSVYEEVSPSERYNTSLVFNRRGELCGTYRKIHIPHDPAFYELNYFNSGDLGFRVFDIGQAKVGVLICYDQWFPEAARAASLMGAEILFYPTAIGTVDNIPCVEGDWHEAWETVQRGHAIANNVVVCAVNRTGREGTSVFWGGSFICNGFGKILERASDQPELIIAAVDLGHSAFTRDTWRFFESRRPDVYGAIVARGA